MENEIAEEMANYQNYSNRRRREMKKKHAFETKQHPKNLKVSGTGEMMQKNLKKTM
jgi:hypothetical protein